MASESADGLTSTTEGPTSQPPLRVLCLVDGPVISPDRWMWNHLPEAAQTDEVEFVSTSPPDIFKGLGKIISYYPAFLWSKLSAIRRSARGRYDVIVAWESKNGFALGLVRRLLHIRQPKLLVLYFSYKGLLARLPLLGRIAVGGIDMMTVSARTEVAHYQRLLGVREAAIRFNPLGWHDESRRTQGQRPEESTEYIFAGGRSDRDYATLFAAVAGLDVLVIVATRPFAVRGLTPPPNVVLRYDVSPQEYPLLLGGSMFAVVPIERRQSAAGLLHIIALLSHGKPVIASRTGGAPDYIDEGETGILVEPSDPRQLREAILHLLSRPDEVARMGRQARDAYMSRFQSEVSAQRSYELIRAVALGRSEA